MKEPEYDKLRKLRISSNEGDTPARRILDLPFLIVDKVKFASSGGVQV